MKLRLTARSTSIGELAVANKLRGVAVGANSTVTGDYGSVLGSEAQAGLNATALGHAARASSDNSVALGANSVADGSASDLSKAGYSIDGSAVAGNAMGEVSVGSAGSERRITNVAAGLSDTDAVNVSQLKVTDAAVSSIDGRVTTIEGDITSINSVLDGVVKYDRNGDGSVNYDSITLGGGADGTKITNVAAGDVSETSKDAINGSQLWAVDQSITSLGTTVTNLTTNIENGTIGPVQRTGTDQLSLIAAGGDAATPGAAQVLTNVADGAINTSSLDAINGSQLYALASSTANALGGDSTVNADGTVTAPTYVVDGSTVNNVGAAITAIDSVLAATVRYDDASHDTITLGGADGTQIKNVAAGVADTDAVNVGQLNALGDQVTSIDGRVSTVEGDVTSINTQIGDINNSITSIDGRVSNVEGSITTINTNIANLGDQVTSIDSRVTTLEGGWNVADEGGAGGAIKAGDVLTFKGDGSNTTVTYDDATKQMTVALEKDITVDSVTAGNTVMDTNGVTIVGGPSMTTAGIDAASMKIVNVAAGTASTDAVNVSQLQGVTNIIGGDTYIDSSTGAVTGPFITIGGDTYNTVADAIEGVDQGAVKYDRNGDGSVNYDSITLAGGADGTKITNVAAGDVSETSKDAINGSQLWAVQQDISTLGDTPMTFVGNSGSVDKKLGETFSIEGDALTAGMYSGANVKTEVDANGRLQIQIADNPGFTSVITGDTVMSDSGLTIASGPSITKTGIDAGSMKIANVAAGADDTDAVNVSQLKAVADATGNLSDRAVQYDLNTDGTANYNTVTLAGTDGTQIKNVADGVDAHDAVNVGQLSSGGDIYNTLTTDITNNVHNVYGDTLRYFKADGANDGSDDAQVVAGTNSAAIGANSVADRANTVSVGSVGNERQIVNVAAGTQDTDAVNVSQLKGVTNIIGGDTYIDASTGEVRGPFITIGGDTYTTVADAITHIDGRVTNIEGNITSITGVLDGVVVYDRNSDDTVNHDTITLDGANGTQIKNVADGVDAHDAVNVGQLSVGGDIYNTLTSDITNNVHNVYGDTLRYFKADGANDGTDDAQVVAGTNSAAIGANSVADRANTVSVGSVGNERQIVNVAAGTQDTDAVNVSQLKGIADVIGGGTTINNDGSITNPTFVINGGDTYTTVADAITNIDGRVTTLEGDITNINNGGGIKYFHANSTLNDSVASGTNSVAVGPQAVASGTDAVAIGNNAQAATANSVALGANSKTADAVSTASGTVGGTRYTYAGGTAAGTVSVGDAGAERTITNVAAGRVSADSTDAVNGSQLYATNQAIETLSGTVSNIDARVTNLEGSVTNINGDIANIYNELGNQLVKQDADTRTLTVGAATDGKVINVSGTAGDRTITGLAAGVADNDAVNVSQLKGVQEQVTNIYNTGSKYFQANSTLDAAQAKGADSVAIGGNAQATADNSVAIGSNAVADRANTVSVGAAGNERQITNVAEGTQGTDAVNVNQLNNAVGNVTNNFNQQIGEVNNRIDDVDKTARRGIAAAAALQIVTPYLPGRTVVNAGVANYRGAGAVGVGVSRWNEKGTVNYNAGVFNFDRRGQGHHLPRRCGLRVGRLIARPSTKRGGRLKQEPLHTHTDLMGRRIHNGLAACFFSEDGKNELPIDDACRHDRAGRRLRQP
ncbi:MAG: YadA-like family protein [Rhodocyclaceae bacterium]